MLASSNVNIKVLAQNQDFLAEETLNVNLRRNMLYLFDQLQNETVKMDVSLGVSLVDRDSADKLQGKMDRVCPNIPGARMTGKEDKGPLHMQKPQPHDSAAYSKMQKPHTAAPMMTNNYVDEKKRKEYDPTDPHAVIRAGKVPVKQAPPPVDDSAGQSAGTPVVANITDREDEEAQLAYAKERKDFV